MAIYKKSWLFVKIRGYLQKTMVICKKPRLFVKTKVICKNPLLLVKN